MLHSKPLFAFDWDDVLHNTAEMRDFESTLFGLAGVPPEATAAAAFRVRMSGSFSLPRLIGEIGSYYPAVLAAAPTLQRVYHDTWEQRGSLVFPDAEKFIQKLYGRFPLAIITIGDAEFQQRKVYRSGLGSLFNHMMFLAPQKNVAIAGQEKARAIGQLLELYPSVIYFDDRQEIISAVHDEHSKHGRVIPFRVERRNEPARYSHVITSFDHPLPPFIERLIA